MKCCRRNFLLIVTALFLCFSLSACGGSPTRFDPGIPAKVAAVSASADNGAVALNWVPVAQGTATEYTGYNVYYGTSPTLTKSTALKSVNVSGTSLTVTGLTNDTTYYFAVAAETVSGEGPLSAVLSATPVLPGPFTQADLAGTWNFNILITGPQAGWMRGRIVVDDAGSVSFSSFRDSLGNTVAPAALFPALLLNPTGHVRDDEPAIANFHGVVAQDRKVVVGTASWGGGSSQLMAILQRQLPNVTFTAADLQGFGSTGGGGRRFIYDQISAGASTEWEIAAGQIGRDQKVQYSGFLAPSNPVRPIEKATIFNITADGVVTESLTGLVPQPAVVMDSAVMSADKTMMVGTATAGSGAGARYVLRIYHFINIIPSDPSTFTTADLAGNYAFEELVGGATALSAEGTFTVGASGNLDYTAFADSSNGSTPGSLQLVTATNGMVTSPVDTSLYGKLSYFKKILVITKTEMSGASSLTIGLKQ